jgi:hypothetical protein
MGNPFRNGIAVAAVILAVLIAAPACQVESEEPVLKTDHRIALEGKEVEGKIKWRPIEPLTVKSGDTIRITVGEHTAWFLIPDNRFKLLEGGSDWVITKDFTAFKVESPGAVIQMDVCDSAREPDEEIHYSVLVRHASGAWEYVHGSNPPPRMTVPPKR